MTWISFFRMGIFGFTALISFVMIAIAGHSANIIENSRRPVYDFQGLAIAAAVLSLAGLMPLLIVGFLRKGSWLTMNVVEIPVVGFLWILWFALAILCTSWAPLLFPNGCSIRANAVTKTFCSEFFAIEGLAFVLWIFLLAYVGTMIVICIIGKSRGHAVWLVPADTPNYFQYDPNVKPASAPSEVHPTQPMVQTPSSYPPQQQPIQQQYTGQQSIQPQYTGLQQQPVQQQYTGPQQPYSPQMQQQPYTPQVQQQPMSYPSSPVAGVAQV